MLTSFDNNNIKGGIADTGDFNGDGHLDVLIGSRYTHYYRPYSGTAWILYGPFHHQMTGSDFPHVANAEVVLTAGENERMDRGIFINDMDGDGSVDLCLGTSQFYHTGRAYMVLGPAEGHVALDQESIVLSRNQEHANSAYTIAAPGDINGDNLPDLLISTLRYNDSEGNSNLGVIDFLYGRMP